MSDDVVELETWIAASPETVLPFLTDPRHLLRWIGMAALARARAGGVVRIAMNARNVARGA